MRRTNEERVKKSVRSRVGRRKPCRPAIARRRDGAGGSSRDGAGRSSRDGAGGLSRDGAGHAHAPARGTLMRRRAGNHHASVCAGIYHASSHGNSSRVNAPVANSTVPVRLEFIRGTQPNDLAPVISGITVIGDVLRPDGRGQPGGVDRATTWLFDAIKRQLHLACGLPIDSLTTNASPALRSWLEAARPPSAAHRDLGRTLPRSATRAGGGGKPAATAPAPVLRRL